LKIDMTSFFSAEGGPIWIKFRRLVQNDMSTAVIWSKSKPDVEFQYGGRLGGIQWHVIPEPVLHCSVLPLGEFTVMIPELHATSQGVRIPSAILKIVFSHILFFKNAVCALMSGGFRIVFDTLVAVALDADVSSSVVRPVIKRGCAPAFYRSGDIPVPICSSFTADSPLRSTLTDIRETFSIGWLHSMGHFAIFCFPILL